MLRKLAPRSPGPGPQPSAGLTAGARAAVLLHEQDGPDKEPLQIKRVSCEREVQPLMRESEPWAARRERYIAPKDITKLGTLGLA